MRIVLDTNVVVSALLWRGAPSRLWEFACEGESVELFSSDPMLRELSRVLQDPGLAKQMMKVRIESSSLLAAYRAVVKVVTPNPIPPTILADPDDDVVLATALAAQADLLVSGDGAVRAVGAFRGIRIVTPAEALALIAT